MGGKLVEPMSAKEQDAVAALAKVSLGMQNYWIGLTDKEIEDKVVGEDIVMQYLN